MIHVRQFGAANASWFWYYTGRDVSIFDSISLTPHDTSDDALQAAWSKLGRHRAALVFA